MHPASVALQRRIEQDASRTGVLQSMNIVDHEPAAKFRDRWQGCHPNAEDKGWVFRPKEAQMDDDPD